LGTSRDIDAPCRFDFRKFRGGSIFGGSLAPLKIDELRAVEIRTKVNENRSRVSPKRPSSLLALYTPSRTQCRHYTNTCNRIIDFRQTRNTNSPSHLSRNMISPSSFSTPFPLPILASRNNTLIYYIVTRPLMRYNLCQLLILTCRKSTDVYIRGGAALRNKNLNRNWYGYNFRNTCLENLSNYDWTWFPICFVVLLCLFAFFSLNRQFY